jgi:hypothetical protein
MKKSETVDSIKVMAVYFFAAWASRHLRKPSMISMEVPDGTWNN